MRDYRLWWALFVFFAVCSVLVIQSRYRRWRQAGRLVAELAGTERAAHARRLRLEGWRLVLMIASVVAMTGLVFAVFLGAPPAVISLLRALALAAVLGVLLLGFRS